MDCSICTTMPFILRPPRNTICAACYEGARNLIALINRFDGDHKGGTTPPQPIDKTGNAVSAPSNSSSSSSASSKGFVNVLKWVKETREMEEELQGKLSFLTLKASFTGQIHTDILVKPGVHSVDGSPAADPIPAHRAMLASKSEIFKNMLDSDGCKAGPSNNDTITLPELNHDELESLLEFLYSGSLPQHKIEKHVYSLSVAADKYEIPFLQKFCERHMLASLSSTKVLDVLEIADLCSNQTLKNTALSFVVKNMEDIVHSSRFETFALKNPHLCVQIIRASMLEFRARRTV